MYILKFDNDIMIFYTHLPLFQLLLFFAFYTIDLQMNHPSQGHSISHPTHTQPRSHGAHHNSMHGHHHGQSHNDEDHILDDENVMSMNLQGIGPRKKVSTKY